MNELPAPTIDDRTRPYWEGLAQGVLRVQHCAACGHDWLPARDACPNCLATEIECEARDSEQLNALVDALRAEGFEVSVMELN